MNDLVALLGLLFPFFALVALGAGAAKLARLPEDGLAAMQVFIVYLALPCLFFRLISATPVAELANGRFVLATTLATALCFGLAFAVTRRGAPGAEAVMGGVAGAYANVGYMGPPLVVSLLGTAAAAPVALVFVFDTLFLFSVVPAAMALCGAGGAGWRRAAAEVVRRIVLHPFMLATAAGLAASVAAWRPPAPVDAAIGWLAAASAPAALFALGVTVACRPVGRIGREVGVLVAIKLLLHPAAAATLLALIGGIDPVWFKAAVAMAALPPALNVFVLARQYRVGIERSSACVLVGTVVSVATLTAIAWVLTRPSFTP